MLPEHESAVLKYLTARTIAVDHTGHDASYGHAEALPRGSQSELPGCHHFQCCRGNGSSKYNSDGILRKKRCVIGHPAPLLLEW